LPILLGRGGELQKKRGVEEKLSETLIPQILESAKKKKKKKITSGVMEKSKKEIEKKREGG